jgi:hypothetical protein
MLTSLTRIIADRSVGALYFGNYYLMDYELSGRHVAEHRVTSRPMEWAQPLKSLTLPVASGSMP